MVWWWFAYCSLILAFWWCDCDSLVDEWSDSGVGVVLGESWDEDPVWLGWWLFIWLWFMEFGLTVWLWLCRRAAGRGWVVLLVLLGDPGQSWFTIIDWSLWWLVDWWFWLCFDGESGWLSDEWWMVIRCFGDRWFVVSVAVYLLLVAHVLWLFGRRRVNCRVVWGLDRWGWRGLWDLVIDSLMFLVGDWCESCFSGDQVGLLMNCY